jgi:hypothetical protein
MYIDWPDYFRVHVDRGNLLVHLLAVPLFISAFILIPVYLIRGAFGTATIAAVLVVIAFALQGIGHGREAHAPRPFSSPLNFVVRVLREQFYIFPLFVLSGRWWQQFWSASGNSVNDS